MNGQSRRWSLIETATGALFGYVVAVITTGVVLPSYGYMPSLAENMQITLIFMTISIIRGYVWRRLFNWLQQRRDLRANQRLSSSLSEKI